MSKFIMFKVCAGWRDIAMTMRNETFDEDHQESIDIYDLKVVFYAHVWSYCSHQNRELKILWGLHAKSIKFTFLSLPWQLNMYSTQYIVGKFLLLSTNQKGVILYSKL